MAQATLTITLPERLWLQQISTGHPTTTFRVLAAVPGENTGFALVRIDGPDVERVIEEMIAHPQLTELTIAEHHDGEATVHFETTAPLLLFSSRESGIPIELPVDVADGEATVEVTGSRERLAELAQQFERFGLEYRIERVRERLQANQLLSDRQLEVVEAAVDAGYYDTPRQCSLTELADRLGVAKSTCSETLHRAEEAIVKRFVADLPNLDDDEAETEPETEAEAVDGPAPE